MARRFGSTTLLLLALCGLTFAQSITIQLKHGTDAERRTKEQLDRIVASYDLSKYTFTHSVLIDEKSIPHSHPVLTLHTRHLGQDDLLLSTYIHEQLHWFLDQHHKQTEAAEQELRKLYPNPPIGYPEGSPDAEGDYLHLIDCYFEMLAARELMGSERAAKVMDFWAGDHYTWVYKTVMRDEGRIGSVVEQHNLFIK